jgi:hypothetical protein
MRRPAAGAGDVDEARADRRRYLKGGEVTLTPESVEGREVCIARADFLPLVFLTEKIGSSDELEVMGQHVKVLSLGRLVEL